MKNPFTLTLTPAEALVIFTALYKMEIHKDIKPMENIIQNDPEIITRLKQKFDANAFLNQYGSEGASIIVNTLKGEN